METKFNFKSQICTTSIQSERLLSLGLKKETADCYYFYCDIAKEWKCTVLSSTQVFKDYPTTVIPAWSMHRLIKLAYGNWDEDIVPIYLGNAYDMLIGRIEFQVKQEKFNKEYLV